MPRHIGIEAEFVEKDVMTGELKAPDYAALNPNMKVPTLVDGDYIKAGSDMRPAQNPALADPWPTEAATQSGRA